MSFLEAAAPKLKANTSMTNQLIRTTTSDGVEILVQPIPAMRSCSVGFWVRRGSCQEDSAEEGMAHFIEHMVFKGTEKFPSPEDIAEYSDCLGGHIDAFTGKENACFYGKVLREKLPALVDLLGDLVTAPLFDPDEISREKDVVLEEINQSEDQPDDWASELFYQKFWEGCPLSHPILGSPEQVRHFSPDSAKKFFSKTYRPKNLLVVASGDVDSTGFADLVEKRLKGRVKKGHAENGRNEAPNTCKPFIYNSRRRNLNQTCLAMGFPSTSHRHGDRVASALLCHILGGGMSSRLFLELREKRALCYQIGSYSSHYIDSGALQIVASCAPNKARELVNRTMAECIQLADLGPSQAELDRAKLQLRTSLVFSQESTSSRMFSIAHQAMHMEKIMDMDQQLAEIDSVGLEAIRGVAKAILDPRLAGIVALGTKSGSNIRLSDL